MDKIMHLVTYQYMMQVGYGQGRCFYKGILRTQVDIEACEAAILKEVQANSPDAHSLFLTFIYHLDSV